MTNESHSGYQYNRCSSRGICSINPATASLLEVIFIYLKLAALFGLRTNSSGNIDKRIKNLVLNTISILTSNYELSETNFRIINSAFKKEMPEIIKKLGETDSFSGISDLEELLQNNSTLNDYIKFGEKEFNKRVLKLSTEERNLQRILFILIKSMCINILTYESFGETAEEEIISVFNILNSLDMTHKDIKDLTDIIYEISAKDCSLMLKIRNIQEKYYGEQKEYDVSFSTIKGKAVLVVGSNLRELEQILDTFSDNNIDIYTHDNMITAHSFPKFREYKNLKGHYGQGIERCLLDFSTFPGPIILTRNSLFNVESLYRGRLFTTDFAYSQGVIPIKNDDFSEVIKSAKESSGFKSGKNCRSEKIGFSMPETLEKINKKLENDKPKKLIIIGIDGYSSEEKEYFEKFLKHVPDDLPVISFSCCENKDNIVCLNAASDIYSMLGLSKTIAEKTQQKICMFFPFVDRHTLSVIIHLSSLENTEIFAGNWNQNIINPNVMSELKTTFGIIEISSPKKDLKIITDKK